MSNAASPNPTLLFPTFRKLFGNSLRAGNDWQKTLAETDLPNEIKDLIRSVVNKSRLFRFEKAQVATELISHFQDGKLCGQSCLQLAKNFGDPAVTACLIRRSKKRNRPMFMKISKGLGFGAGALATAYLAVLAFFHLGKTNPTIDYMAYFNSNIADIEQANMAWPLYRPLWTKYGFSEGGECNFDEMYTTDADGNKELVRPTDENWPEAVAMLEDYEDLLATFRVGAKLPALGLELKPDPTEYSDEDFAALFPHADKENFDQVFDINWDANSKRIMDGALIGVLLPHIQSFRKAARVLTVDTRLAMIQGDSDRAVENIETVLGLAHQAAEPQCLVCGLVGIAVATIGFDQLEEVITTDEDFFSEEQLARLQSKIDDLPIQSWIKYEGERASIKDVIQRCYTDSGNGNGRMTADGVEVLNLASNWMTLQRQERDIEGLVEAARPIYAPVSMFLCAGRKELTEKTDEFIDQFIADAELPYWISDGVDLNKVLKENKVKYMLLGLMLPANQQVKCAAYRSVGRQEGVITALAIHRYFKKYGQWPTDYDQISPEFVNEFPVDQVDGSLVKFKYDDGELTVYSVGRDRDDDGGVHSGDLGRSIYIFGPKSDTDQGDWILWPVQNYSLQ